MSAGDGDSSGALASRVHGKDVPTPAEKTRVLVTRSRKGPGRLRSRLEAAGFGVVSVPTIEFRALDTRWISDLLEPSAPWDWTIFTSRTTLDFIVERLGQNDLSAYADQLGGIAAVGQSTARKLEELGLTPRLVPQEFDAEGLIEMLRPVELSGKRVALPRALDAREILPEWLRAEGAQLSVIEVYESYRPTQSISLLKQLTPDVVDVLTFASSNTVRNFDGLLDVETAWLRGVVCACIGPITRSTAEELGYKALDLPSEYTFDGLVEFLDSWREGLR